MKEFFDVIKAARSYLASLEYSDPCDNTRLDYEAKVQVLARRAKDPTRIEDIISEACKTRKVSTWNARRSAIIYCLRSRLASQLAQQDRDQRIIKNLKDMGLPFDVEFQRWVDCVQLITQLHADLIAIYEEKGLPKEARTPRHSKKEDMKKLPHDWRDRLIVRLANYHLVASAMAAAGCRPVELMFGVQLKIEPAAISALVHGAKGGQEWRIFRWQLDHPSPVIQHLIRETKDSHGSLLVQAQGGSRPDGRDPFCRQARVAGQSRGDYQLLLSPSDGVGYESFGAVFR